MSVVAEYAANLHKREPKNHALSSTFVCDLSAKKLDGVKVAIFDIYGTLINYCPANFIGEDEMKERQAAVFLKTAQEFGFTETLEKIDPSSSAATSLANFYAGLLLMLRERDEKAGKKFSEPQVNDVWNLILAILARNGYDFRKYGMAECDDFAKCIAYFFHFHSFARSALFKNLGKTFGELKSKGIRLGLLANTQFYTTFELSLLLREDSIAEDYLDIFDGELCFFSYDFKMSKQSAVLHKKLFDILYDMQILPKDALFISANEWDLSYAEQIGMRTAKANAQV